MIEQFCIFLTSGKTFWFYDVKIQNDKDFLSFTYVSKTDKKTKFAMFNKELVAGTSETLSHSQLEEAEDY